MFAVGTIVRPAHDRTTKRTGTVTRHSLDGKLMLVHWHGQPTACGYFTPGEVKQA